MKGFRFRLSSLLWLVAVAAAVLWGIRYHYQQDREVSGETYIYREGKRGKPIVIKLSPDEMAEMTASWKVEVHRGQKTEPNRGER
jgi:hypothetical protein